MIKVSYLVSYDYYMFLTSVSQLYDYVDQIVVSIDKDRKTWSGNNFEIPDSFFEEVKRFDKNNKIDFYFDTFYLTHLTPMENETRQRNLVLSKLGKGWKIQLDVDEYIYDFKTVAKYLDKYIFLTYFPRLTPICLKGKLITLYRELAEGYLFIDNNEQFPFITNQNSNTHTRNNNKVRNFQTNIKVIHQSWARSEDEILKKIKNWGHRDDFDTLQYFEFWRSLNSSNYKEFKNIHPIVPNVWDELDFIKSDSIEDFIKKYALKKPQKLIPLPVSLFIKAIINKITK